MPTMTPTQTLKPALAALFATLLAACASVPAPDVRRDARVPAPVIQVDGVARTAVPGADGISEAPLQGDPMAVKHRGDGRVINESLAASPPPNLAGTTGEATFNFEGESLHAVVKVILGDMLGQNYVIAPGVQGQVTLATPKTVSPAQALGLLEMVLGWNNARMIYADGRYNIVPAEGAVASGAVPARTGNAAAARGFETRVVPLKYVAAAEMEKVLEPYARPNAIVSVDAGRNVITVAGTRQELQNYLRTIEIFDVDWLAGMSVGVFPLVSGRAPQVVEDLEKVFGAESESPVAGMFRFMPLDGANSVLVITSQPAYLDRIEQWIERIDGAGGGVQLFSYELKYVTAKDLAEQLAQVYGGSGQGRSGSSGDNRRGGSLMPGLEPVEISDGGMDGRTSSVGGGRDGSGGGLGSGSLSLGERQGGDASVTLEVDGAEVGVAAVDETNTLLVRATGQAWRSIREVIERLDVMPLQVHIEAQVVEVTLSGDLSYGVNWFFERAVTDAGLPNAVDRTTWSGLAGNVTGTETGAGPAGLAWTFLGRNAAAIISALDEVSDVQMLQTPSVMVRNNYEATLNVGSRIPISSVTVNPGLGGDSSYSQVQYLDTGTILKVRPRVTRDGTVFLDIVQEVSSPVGQPDQNGNVRIDTRRMKTNAVMQSGDTVMLAGLIQDATTRGSAGFPGLSRIPVLGGLFGRQTSNTTRSEVIVLLTPTLVRNQQDARDLTDEYGRRFRALEPLHRTTD